MTHQLLRPLRQWPWLHHHHHHHRCCASDALRHHLLTSPQPTKPTSHRFSLVSLALTHRNLHSRSRALRRTNVPLPTTELQNRGGTGSVSDSDSEPRKGRNQLKREAQRAVQWGMELASFSVPQIKRILRVASLEQDVFEALMLVKRLRPDVREGRRRQFNLIGKLLREVEPELIDRLIKATKTSDHKELQALTGLGSEDLEDDDDLIETEPDEVEEESNWYDTQVTRWFDGLIDKDIQITNEIYSVQGVEFDRQELRKLVRRVHSTQQMKAANVEEEKKVETAAICAKKALTRFLRGLAKRIPNEY